MFKKKIIKINKIIKILFLYNKLIKKLNFTKNIIKGGNPDKERNKVKIKFLNLLNFVI